MSVFSSDIIEKELGYDPDPDKNMRFQIEKKFNRLCDMYSPARSNDVLTFLKYGMSDFMEYLQMNTWRNTGEVILPPEWKGDFLYIDGYRVEIIKLTSGRAGIQVSWRYTNSLEYQSIDLCIDITGFMEKYKNWVV